MALRLMRNEGTLSVFRLLAAVAKNEAGELSSICHSSTEISSLEVDVAESLFAELQSS